MRRQPKPNAGPVDPRAGPGSVLRQLDAPTRKYQHKEAPEQASVAQLYGGLGMAVYQNSVFGVQPKGVTPGIADLHPKWVEHRWEFDHEVKAQGGKQSEAQWRYMIECKKMGSIYVLGGTDSAIDFLIWLKLGERAGPTIRLHPRERIRAQMARNVSLGPAILAGEWYASPEFLNSVDVYGYSSR